MKPDSSDITLKLADSSPSTSDSVETPSSEGDSNASDTNAGDNRSSFGYELDSNWSFIFTDDNLSTDYDQRSNASSAESGDPAVAAAATGYHRHAEDVISESESERITVSETPTPASTRRRKSAQRSRKVAPKGEPVDDSVSTIKAAGSTEGSVVQLSSGPATENTAASDDKDKLSLLDDVKAGYKLIKKYIIYILLGVLTVDKTYRLFEPVIFPVENSSWPSLDDPFLLDISELRTITAFTTKTETATLTETIKDIAPFETFTRRTLVIAESKVHPVSGNNLIDDTPADEFSEPTDASVIELLDASYLDESDLKKLSSWDLIKLLHSNFLDYGTQITDSAVIGASNVYSDVKSVSFSFVQKTKHKLAEIPVEEALQELDSKVVEVQDSLKTHWEEVKSAPLWGSLYSQVVESSNKVKSFDYSGSLKRTKSEVSNTFKSAVKGTSVLYDKLLTSEQVKVTSKGVSTLVNSGKAEVHATSEKFAKTFSDVLSSPIWERIGHEITGTGKKVAKFDYLGKFKEVNSDVIKGQKVLWKKSRSTVEYLKNSPQYQSLSTKSKKSLNSFKEKTPSFDEISVWVKSHAESSKKFLSEQHEQLTSKLASVMSEKWSKFVNYFRHNEEAKDKGSVYSLVFKKEKKKKYYRCWN